jgi:hypothetical protein
MSENQFDEFFRNKLNAHSSPVPEDMWQRIQQKKDKDRKGFILWIWYFLGSMLLLISLAGGYFILHSNKNIASKKSVLFVNELANKQTTTDEAKNKNEKQINAKQDTSYFNQTNKIAISKAQINNDEKNAVSNEPDNKMYKTKRYILIKNKPEEEHLKQKTDYDKNIYSASNNKSQVIQSMSVPAPDSSINNNQQNGSVVKADLDSLNNNKAQNKSSAQKNLIIKNISDTVINESKKGITQSFLRKRSWFLDVYFSPDIPFNNTNPSSINSYFKPEFSYTIGLRLDKSFGKHFSGKIGIQFSQINESSTLDSNSTIRHFHYKSIDVPLLVGYEIQKPHFNLTINAGLIFNIYSWYSPNGRYNLEYKKYTGYSLYLGFNYARPVNDKLIIFTEPYFRYRISNMVNSDEGFSQKINVAGLSLGVRYKFRRKTRDK